MVYPGGENREVYTPGGIPKGVNSGTYTGWYTQGGTRVGGYLHTQGGTMVGICSHRVYTGLYAPYHAPYVHTRLYTTLYTPGYTSIPHWHAGVLRCTVLVLDDEALGSKRE